MIMLLTLGCIGPNAGVSDPGLVREVADLIDTRYALFVDKEVDWDAARDDALDTLDADPEAELDTVIVEMLQSLRDAHVNLATPTNVSFARSFIEEEIPTFDADLVQRHVLGFEFNRVGDVLWAVPDPEWGYLRIDSLSSLPGNTTLDAAFEDLGEAPGLVLDLRSNGGGSLGETSRLLGRFLDRTRVGWHVQYSTGPAHDDLSDPEPRDVSRVRPGFDGPLAVLVDGRTYSAANLVAFVLGRRDDTVFVGAPTGGGAGSPTWRQLSNRWELRFPTIRLTGADLESMEDGFAVDLEVMPDPAQPTVDVMIEAAVEALGG